MFPTELSAIPAISSVAYRLYFRPSGRSGLQEEDTARHRPAIATGTAVASIAAGGVWSARPAAAVETGEVFRTQGLVCDRPSYVDAVVTLAESGEDLQGAMA